MAEVQSTENLRQETNNVAVMDCGFEWTLISDLSDSPESTEDVKTAEEIDGDVKTAEEIPTPPAPKTPPPRVAARAAVAADTEEAGCEVAIEIE